VKESQLILDTYRGDITAVTAALDAGGGINQKSYLGSIDKGKQLIHIAAQRGDTKLVELLVKRNQNVVHSGDGQGNTALYHTSNPQIIDMLLQAGASAGGLVEVGKGLSEWRVNALCTAISSVCADLQDVQRPLLYKTINQLLGTNLSSDNLDSSQDALHAAIDQKYNTQQGDKVAAFLKESAFSKTPLLQTYQQLEEKRPLNTKLYNYGTFDLAVATRLIAAGANPSALNRARQNPLHLWAAGGGSPEITACRDSRTYT
jgi:hypothetical protein